MTADELKKVHEEYRRALEQARDESLSEETRANAGAAVLDLRKQIDSALIEDKAEREEEKRSAAVEARANAAKLAADAVSAPESPVPVDAIRAYGHSKRHGETLSFTVPLVAPNIDIKGADWTTSDSTTYTSYTVPQSWANEVYLFQVASSGVLAANPSILRTANGNQINYPKLVTDMSANAGTEGSAATETNPVFGTTPLNSYRVDGWTPIADEVFRDSGVDVDALLRRLAARSLAIKAAGYYGDADIGTGSSLPAAITIGTTLGKTAAGVDSVTLDELKELQHSVLREYQARAKWIANADITLEVALAKDGEGRYMMQPSASAGEPDTVFGKPWFRDDYFDASGTGNKVVVYGDIEAAYIVRFIGGVEVTLSRDFAFTSFETTARFAMWHDAATIDTIAAKHLILA